MDPIDVLGFDHVDLTVNDVERSQAFYAKVLGALGFRLIHETWEAAVIAANGHTRSPSARRARPRGRELRPRRVGLHTSRARRAPASSLHAWLVDQV
jgi:catechol 2,3-dioxygenase-like lactoylglutathione lyase family enzyme